MNKSEITKNSIVIKDEVYSNVMGELIKAFDKLCMENNIEYFAFGSLLVGSIHYKNFVPGSSVKACDIGLVRSEYNRLIPILREKADGYGFFFDENIGLTSNLKPIVQIGKELMIDTPEVSVRKMVWLFISPFDKAPVSRDYQYGFFKTMLRLNERYKIVTGMKGPSGILSFIEKLFYTKLSNAKSVYKRLIKESVKYNSTDSNVYVRIMHDRSERITEEQLYPITRRKFRDFEISTPHDYSVWTDVMDEKLKFQIASIQKADLEILKEFDRVCQKLGIGYFVCGGTMLGYVRHGGFIPWDDDIDVGMLRADYNRFINEAAQLLDSRFFLQTRESDPKIPYLFSKIRMNNTEYITDYNYGRNFHKGICLDLFPFDYIPNDFIEQMEFKAEVLKKAKIHNKICNMSIPEPDDGKVQNFEDFWYRAERKARRFYFKHRSLKRSQNNYIKTATRYNDNAKELGLDTVASFVPSYTYVKLDDLLPYRRVMFEGVETQVPNKPEVFLKMQYGDYMRPPLEHQQVGHPLIRWSVDTSKGSYVNGEFIPKEKLDEQ